MRERRIPQSSVKTPPMSDAEATANRLDKLKLHSLMGNHAWLIRQLGWYVQLRWKIMELGAGDGYVSLQFVKKGFCWKADLHGLDLLSRPLSWPDEASWSQGDIFSRPLPKAQILVANFFLHPFSAEQLRRLGQMIPAETQMLLIVEPARYQLAAFLAKWWGLFLLNRRGRKNLQTSFRAGFRGRELPNLLGLGNDWEIVLQKSVFGSYRMMAWRVEGTEANR